MVSEPLITLIFVMGCDFLMGTFGGGRRLRSPPPSPLLKEGGLFRGLDGGGVGVV